MVVGEGQTNNKRCDMKRDFLDFVVYYPEHVPWLGPCSVLMVGIESGVATISNNRVTTTAPVESLLWCPFTGQLDMSGGKVYLSDLLENGSDEQFLVCYGSGSYFLTTVPDGGVKLPLQYAGRLARIGSMHGALKFQWVSVLKERLSGLSVDFEKSRPDIVGSNQKVLLNDWERKSVALLEEFSTLAHTMIRSFIDDAVERGAPHGVLQTIKNVLSSIGYNVELNLKQDSLYWSVDLIVDMFTKNMSGVSPINTGV